MVETDFLSMADLVRVLLDVLTFHGKLIDLVIIWIIVRSLYLFMLNIQIKTGNYILKG